MQSAAAPERRGWLAPVLLIVLAVTAARLLALAFDRTDLFLDESQYWLWGQDLAFGYYSKPPLIGWVIRAVTTIAGSEAPFFVRLAAPLAHAATAVLLAATAAELAGRRAAVWVAAGYLSLPMVGVGSLLITTDTIMFPFLALALWAWLRAARGGGAGYAALAGLGLGLGAMAKYAALYFILGGALAALLVTEARPGWRAAGIALGVAFLCLLPNILWNAVNGWPTLHHTADNMDWVNDPEDRTGLHLGAALSFLAAQFGVFGPLSFAGLLALSARWRRRAAWERAMIATSLPVVALVTVQALLSHAFANWAVAAYLPAALLLFACAARHPRFGALTVAVNAAICLFLIALVIYPEAVVMPNGRALMARYMGRAAVSREIIATARANHLRSVVATSRALQADLFYTGRASGLGLYAAPAPGCPAGDTDCYNDQYQMTHPVPPVLPGDALFATPGGPPRCGGEKLKVLQPVPGTWQRGPVTLWRVPGDCWVAKG
ncbi:ArnT family glycosyltransferase [Solirhodobacter olei]|uniref:ArnT family glycosyltransferase n=1 Tax=Solirhodobacter olei TaxID=2493082 RepID=UPI000FDC8573|nr:glycosyltransferase family 39 protein [Solirhodobacter olei]